MSPFFAFWTLLIQAICLGRSSSESGDQSTHAVRGSPTTLCEGLQTPHSRMTEGLTARQEPTPFGRPEVGDVRRGQETCAERDLCRAPSARWCATRTGYDALDARIAKTLAKREELLTVLSEPTVPLHNNASELGARVSARRRDVSLHSRSERGARAMDIFTTLVQTSKKLGQSAYAYLCDRLRGTYHLPSLAQAAASG